MHTRARTVYTDDRQSTHDTQLTLKQRGSEQKLRGTGRGGEWGVACGVGGRPADGAATAPTRPCTRGRGPRRHAPVT